MSSPKKTGLQAELNVSADLAAIIGTKKGEKISRPQVNRNSFAVMYISFMFSHHAVVDISRDKFECQVI